MDDRRGADDHRTHRGGKQGRLRTKCNGPPGPEESKEEEQHDTAGTRNGAISSFSWMADVAFGVQASSPAGFHRAWHGWCLIEDTDFTAPSDEAGLEEAVAHTLK